MWLRRALPAGPDEKTLDELAKAFLIQEHSSLRAEVLASYGYAQSIVKWTLATFATGLAAALVAVYNANSNAILFNMALIIFGVGLPGVIWLNSWTWLGELYRAERAGSYLRAVEADLERVPGLVNRLGFQPARWESFIASNREVKGLWGKQTITYLGTAGIFFGTASGSALFFWNLWVQLNDSGKLIPADATWIWWAIIVAINLVGLSGCVIIYRRLMKLGKEIAPVAARYPRDSGVTAD